MTWCIAIFLGARVFIEYSAQPGAPAEALESWPSSTRLTRNANPTLVVFLHPKCPCSRATVTELENLLTRAQVKPLVHAVFVQSEGFSEADVKGELWKRTRKITGVQTLIDFDRAEMRAFGAKTSGHVFLYDRQQRLVFDGGITPARGHIGDSRGKTTLLSFLNEGRAPINRTPVFGCALNKKTQLAGVVF